MPKKVALILALSLLMNVALVSVVGAKYLKGKSAHGSTFSPYYLGQVSVFESMPDRQGEVIFLGDSLTERGRWDELLQNDSVINRGIGSDTTAGVLNRLPEITSSKPSKIFLMIGINDIARGLTANEIRENYSEILNTIKEQSPSTEVFLQSVLPVNNPKYGDAVNNADVIEVNKELKTLAARSQATYVDVFKVLSVNDQLKDEYTVDGIHLTGAAYENWKNEIEAFVS